jgi:ATP-binding cassette subfamily B protein
MVRISALFTSTLQVIPLFGQAVVLGIGGWMAVNGQLTVGTLVAFFSYLTQLAAPARMLAMFLAATQLAR